MLKNFSFTGEITDVSDGKSSNMVAQTVLMGSVLIKVEIKNKWFSGMCPSKNKRG